MIDSFEEENPLLHKFFIEGGQISKSKRSGIVTTLPDSWFEVDANRVLQTKILDAFNYHPSFSGWSVAEVAQQLQISYRDVLQAIRMQELGSIKTGGVIQIYRPSLQAYIRKQENRKARFLI